MLLIQEMDFNNSILTKIHTLAKKCAPNILNLMFHIILSFKSYLGFKNTFQELDVPHIYFIPFFLKKLLSFIPHENIKSIIIIIKRVTNTF
jgi:hypothetical protein